MVCIQVRPKGRINLTALLVLVVLVGCSVQAQPVLPTATATPSGPLTASDALRDSIATPSPSSQWVAIFHPRQMKLLIVGGDAHFEL